MFAEALRAARGVDLAWVELFNEAVIRYFERVTDLARKAPKYWRGARLANVCIVQDPARTRPYYEPFPKSSWLLYESDFDPKSSSVEHATYQLVHVERLGRTGDVGMTWIHNLSYFFDRSIEERQSFVTGCEASTRPDSAAFLELAGLLDRIDFFFHDDVHRGAECGREQTARIAFAGLDVPSGDQATFQRVAKAFLAAGHSATQRHYESQRCEDAGSDSAETLIDWLVENEPMVVLTDHLGGIVWDPLRPQDVQGARNVLAQIPGRAAFSLREDWAVIDRHSRTFLAALVDPESLEFPSAGLDQEDGIFLHRDRKMIAYCLAQPGHKTLAEEAPPYHRSLVGARTLHEWGHLAAEAGIVSVPQDLEEGYDRAHAHVIHVFDAVVERAPVAFRKTAAREVELLRREGFRLGDMPLQRAGDYQANLLAREFLNPTEREAYIRANIRPLIDEDKVGPYLALARYAYEYQYLLLSEIEDAFDYLVLEHVVRATVL